MLDQRAAALGIALLHQGIGERALRLVDVEFGRQPGLEARFGDVERIAPHADRVLEHRDLGVERAQREVGLRNAAREREPDHVLAEPVAEQVGLRRLRGAREAAPEIDLEVGRGEELVARPHDGAGRRRRHAGRADAAASE